MEQATRQPRRKVTAFLLVGALFLLLAVLVVLLSQTRRTQGWQTGTQRIASVEGWGATYFNPFYHWVSDTEIYFISTESMPSVRRRVKKLNVVTGTVSDVTILPQEFTTHQFQGLQVSPDGNYLLWDYFAPGKIQRIGIVDISSGENANRIRTWRVPMPGYDAGFWLPDRSGWFDGKAKILAVNPANVSPVAQYPLDLYLDSQGHGRKAVEILGQIPGGDWITYQWTKTNSGPPSDFAIVRLVAPSNRKPGLPRTIESKVDFGDMTFRRAPLSLSPNGKEVLWLGNRVRNPFHLKIGEWLARIGLSAPEKALDFGQESFLITTNLKGEDQHLVGLLPDNEDGFDHDSIQWTPDSKNVSFVHDGTLYTRPIR